jgi:hypothetical protein
MFLKVLSTKKTHLAKLQTKARLFLRMLTNPPFLSSLHFSSLISSHDLARPHTSQIAHFAHFPHFPRGTMHDMLPLDIDPPSPYYLQELVSLLAFYI